MSVILRPKWSYVFHANFIHLLGHNSPAASGITLETALRRRGSNPRIKNSNILISVGQHLYCVCLDSQEMQLLINNRGAEARSPFTCISVPQKHLRELRQLNPFILLENPILFPSSVFALSGSLPVAPTCTSYVHVISLPLDFSLIWDLVLFTHVLSFYRECRGDGGVYFKRVMPFLLFKWISEPLCCTVILFAKSQLLC